MRRSDTVATNLLIVGHTSIDDIHLPDGRLKRETMGGAALYATIGATMWSGARVGVVTRIGEDVAAERIQTSSWCPDRTDFSGVRTYAGSSIRDSIFHRADGTREVIFVDQSRIAAMTPDVADLSSGMGHARAVHLTPADLTSQHELARHARDHGAMVSLDTELHYLETSERLREVLAGVDVFSPSIEHLRHLFSGSSWDPRDYWDELCSLGPDRIVVKCGEAGAVLFDIAGRRSFAVPALDDLHVADVTGAGDAFCGGFLAGLLATDDIVRALAHGTAAASIVVESVSARCSPEADRILPQRRLEQVLNLVADREWTSHG